MTRIGRAPNRRRGGVTLAEILAVLFIVAVIAAILLPTIATRRERANRIKCAANLKIIAHHMLFYAGGNKGMYPRTQYVPGAPPSVNWDNSNGRANAVVNPFMDPPWSGYANDVAMPLFLLLNWNDLTGSAFNCPGDRQAIPNVFGATPGVSSQNKASFSGPRNLSYSMANPYPDAAAVARGYRWDTTLSADFALAGDLNPGVGGGHDVTAPAGLNASPDAVKRANSRNHAGAGQNVLFGDGHVGFETTPFVGLRRDNIYTVSGSDDGTVTTSRVVMGSPRGGHDSVLLPTRE